MRPAISVARRSPGGGALATTRTVNAAADSFRSFTSNATLERAVADPVEQAMSYMPAPAGTGGVA